MFDCHSHCNHSVDSPTPIDNMIEVAISKGMKYLAFTDHFDRDYLYGKSIDKNIKQIDLSYHIADTLRAKNKYAESIEIACGVECGFSVQSEQDYVNLLDDYKFDLILNSVHSVNGIDCYHSEYFENKDKHTAYKEYLLAVLDSVNAKYDYDIITHIGYVCRRA
ncbi:MAG: histidinol-phosphatase HisJ family protein, partial [Clostridia bacterium]|nr:histidinol-phosphatase HisJ family protein [Clostridia bacterium]